MSGRHRRDWRHDRLRKRWRHTPTGLTFSEQNVTRHGWEKVMRVVTFASEWLDYIGAFPTTTLTQERNQLLILAMDEHDEKRLRQLTLRWTLWHQESTTTGGEARG